MEWIEALADRFTPNELIHLFKLPKRTTYEILQKFGERRASEQLERQRQDELLWLGLQAERDMLRRGDPGVRVPVRRYSTLGVAPQEGLEGPLGASTPRLQDPG